MPLGRSRNRRCSCGSTSGPASIRRRLSSRCCQPGWGHTASFQHLACLSRRELCWQVGSALCPLGRPSLFRPQLQHHLQEARPLPLCSSVWGSLSQGHKELWPAKPCCARQPHLPLFLTLDSKRGSSIVGPWFHTPAHLSASHLPFSVHLIPTICLIFSDY